MALREWIDYCLSGEYARMDVTIYDGYLFNSDILLRLTGDDIVQNSVVFDNYSSSGDLLEIGSVIAEEFDFAIRNPDGIHDNLSFVGKELYVNFQPTHSEAGGVVLGAYIITEAIKKANRISFKCLDRTIQAEKQIDWDELMQYYAEEKADMEMSGEIEEFGNVSAMGRAINDCTRGGGAARIFAQCNKMFDDYSSVQGTSMTYRELLQYIGFITGTCKSRDTEGIYLGWYDHTIYEPEEWTVPDVPDYFESNADNRYSSEIGDKDITITGISYKDSDGNTYMYGTEGYVISATGCRLITASNAQSVIDALGSVLVGFSYRPYEITMKRLPFLYPLTSIKIRDNRNGNVYNSIVTHQTFKINGSTQIAARCKNSVNNEYQNISKLTGATQQAIDESNSKQKEEMEKALKETMAWKVVTLNTKGGTQTITVGEDVLNKYTEFLIACQLAHSETARVLASTVIPAKALKGYTTDHPDGAHQAYYDSTYHVGVSYIGSGRVKIYETSKAYAVLYAR